MKKSKVPAFVSLFSIAYVIVALVAMWGLHSWIRQMNAPREVPYSELVTMVRDGKVQRAELRADRIVAELKSTDGKRQQVVVAERLPGVDETKLVEAMNEKSVTYAGRIERPSLWPYALLEWALPLALIVGMGWYGRRQMMRHGPLHLGKNRAVVHDGNAKREVTFADVAGVDEAKAEIAELVDYLKDPEKYRKIGAAIPRGVLLVGPPGTGKTLLAKAVAGEAGVPFFALSGSSFVEMFVGVGAARVRDLFEQAKVRAPCIVFIDELDAIGKSRGGVAVIGHDEREQTLNQLLVEMDGFDSSKGVILIGATNRPEVLDRALLRPGRFDRQIVVGPPDRAGREEILRVHMKKLALSPDVDVATLARRTPGLVGADLANIVNEAALTAARRGAMTVSMRDFEEALDRAQLGARRRRSPMTDDEKKRVAFHEAGHALVAASLPHADPVHRVTILPRTHGALGATLQLPDTDRHLATRAELDDRLAVLMGGRVAERLALGDVSTGAADDLQRATEVAREMVMRYGMSERVGPRSVGRARGAFLPAVDAERPDVGVRLGIVVDNEVDAMLRAASSRAEAVLRRRRATLDAVAARLLEAETLEGPELAEVLAGGNGPSRPSLRVA